DDHRPRPVVPSLSHDSATTAIYTLSLHDALPIFSAHAKQKEYQLASLTSRLSYEQRQQQAKSVPDRYSAPAIAAANASRVARSRDRKSTRLNSSHVKISYAVFCLKKKKEHGEALI